MTGIFYRAQHAHGLGPKFFMTRMPRRYLCV